MDSPYSWIVAASGSLIYLLVSLPLRVGSQLFVSMLDHFGANRKDTSLPFSIASLIRSLSGPFAGFFGEKFGLQTVTLTGCILGAAGVGACFFVEDVITFDVCFGLIYGMGFGWATALIPEILNQHFDKHRAKGNGIYFGGCGLGAFFVPPLIEIMLNTYGISGTLLMLSAILLNGIPAAMLLRKPEPITARNSKLGRNEELPSVLTQEAGDTISESTKYIKNSASTQQILTNDKNVLNSFCKAENSLILPCLALDSTKNYVHSASFKQITSFNFPYIITKSSPGGSMKISSSDSSDIYSKLNHSTVVNYNETESGFKEHIDGVSKLNGNDLSDQFFPDCIPKDVAKVNKKVSSITDFFKQLFAPFHILCSPVFLLIAFTQGVHNFLNYLFWTITVDYSREKNVEHDLEVYIVMGLALFDTLGRFFVCSIADCGFISVPNLSALLVTLMGLSCMILTWVSSFLPMLIFICFLGLVFGGNTSLQPVMITLLIHKEKRCMAMASRFILYVPMSFALSPLIGYFRGSLGSYNGLMYCMTFLCISCSIIFIFLPRLARYRNNRNV